MAKRKEQPLIRLLPDEIRAIGQWAWHEKDNDIVQRLWRRIEDRLKSPSKLIPKYLHIDPTSGQVR